MNETSVNNPNGQAVPVPPKEGGGIGESIPKGPGSGFAKFGLRREVLLALQKMGYETPTPIQDEAIPLIAQGRDIIAQAETGSGKTAACGIPLVNKVDAERIEIQALILVPTRELAVQYVEEIARISSGTGIRCFAIYGGFSMSVQLAKLRHGIHILVGTPGRLIDHLYRGTLSFSAVSFFVIDEADEMLDLGFLHDVELLAECIMGAHQTLLFSATMPAGIKALAVRYMADPMHITLNRSIVSPKTLRHFFLSSEEVDKANSLVDLIKKSNASQALVFCKSRVRVLSLFGKVKRRLPGSDFLHGGLDQIIRRKIMDRFRAGKLRYLIATDLASRGLDVSGISHVINYDVPMNSEVYTHRTGRTARQGREGMAVSLVSRREMEPLYKIQHRIRVNINRFPSDNSPVPKPAPRSHASSRKDHYRRPTEVSWRHKRRPRKPAEDQ